MSVTLALLMEVVTMYFYDADGNKVWMVAECPGCYGLFETWSEAVEHTSVCNTVNRTALQTIREGIAENAL